METVTFSMKTVTFSMKTVTFSMKSSFLKYKTHAFPEPPGLFGFCDKSAFSWYKTVIFSMKSSSFEAGAFSIEESLISH